MPPPAADTPQAHTLRTHLLVLAGYTLLTVLLTYPIAFRLFSEVPGGGDAWQNIWNLWWTKQALLVEHTNPYHTDMLYYPQGVNLYLHTLVLTAGLTSLPLQLLGFNLIATYNIVVLLTFVLAGYGMYLLCHYLTGNRWASFVGGIVFTFSPYHFAHLFGHMNLASLQWLPFYVLALLKAFEPGASQHQAGVFRIPRGALKWSLLAGALLALNAYTDWLYAIFLVVFTGIFAAWRLMLPVERRELGVGWSAWVGAGARLALTGGTFLLLTAPIFFPTLGEAGLGYAQQPPIETIVYSSDLTSAFTPSELHPLWGEAMRVQVQNTGPYLPLKNPSERVVFLGYATLALAGLAVWRLRRRRAVLFWGVTALSTWLLSLGPFLQWAGKTQFTTFGVTVPMPYLLLYKLPLVSIMRTPGRFTVLTMLALGVLAAFGLTSLLGGGRFAWRRLTWRSAVFGALLPAVILFEYLALPFPTVPPGWNVPIYSKIAQEPGRFALLELPLRPFSDYMAYQTQHGKPIIYGYVSRQPVYPVLEQVPALHYLLNSTPADSVLKSQVDGGQGVQQLEQLDVRYVIIRWWAFTPEEKAAMKTKLANLLPRPPDFSYPADQVDVWRLK